MRASGHGVMLGFDQDTGLFLGFSVALASLQLLLLLIILQSVLDLLLKTDVIAVLSW